MYSIIGPFLSETYAKKILNRIKLIEEEELAWAKFEAEDQENSMEEEKKEEVPSRLN